MIQVTHPLRRHLLRHHLHLHLHHQTQILILIHHPVHLLPIHRQAPQVHQIHLCLQILPAQKNRGKRRKRRKTPSEKNFVPECENFKRMVVGQKF